MTEVNYNGKEELLMADYEGISDSDLSSKYANTDFDITDAPSTYITNTQMTYALTCKRLFPAGDTYICNDEGTYKKGHTYTIKVNGETKSWEDVTPTPTIDDTPTATSNNPVKSSGIYTAIQGKQDKLTAGTNITIDKNNVISASDLVPSNVMTLDTNQTLPHNKILYTPTNEEFRVSDHDNRYYGFIGNRRVGVGGVFSNGRRHVLALHAHNFTLEVEYNYGVHFINIPYKTDGTFALTSDIPFVHHIRISNSTLNAEMMLTIFSKSDAAFTYNRLLSYFNSIFTSLTDKIAYQCSGMETGRSVSIWRCGTDGTNICGFSDQILTFAEAGTTIVDTVE